MSATALQPLSDNPITGLPPLPVTPPPVTATTHANENPQGITNIPSVQRVKATKNQAITRTDDCLDETNWTVWRHRLMLMLQICGVKGYVNGTVKCPDSAHDPEGARNWIFNDTYAKVLIANNVTTTQMVHISQSRTAQESWSNLKAVHDAKSHQTTIAIIRNLYHTSAEEGDNISDLLNKLKRYWELVLKGPVFRTACGPETGPKWTKMDQTFGPSPCF